MVYNNGTYGAMHQILLMLNFAEEGTILPLN